MGDVDSSKKFIKVSQDATTPIHVPILLGNECFVLSKQYLRRLEETELLGYAKVMPNGQLLPIPFPEWGLNITQMVTNLQGPIAQPFNSFHQNSFIHFPMQATTNLQDILGRFNGAPEKMNASVSEDLHVPTQQQQQQEQQINSNTATLEQQLNWQRNICSNAPSNQSSVQSNRGINFPTKNTYKEKPKRSNVRFSTRACDTTDLTNPIVTAEEKEDARYENAIYQRRRRKVMSSFEGVM